MNNNKENIIKCMEDLKQAFMNLSATWDKNQLHYVDLIMEMNYQYEETFPKLTMQTIEWVNKSVEQLKKIQ